jgi:hypothetical protein
MVNYSLNARLPASSAMLEKLHPKVEELAQGNEVARKKLLYLASLQNHYRTQVDAIAKESGTHLIFLADIFHSDPDYIGNEMEELSRAGLSSEVAKNVFDFAHDMQAKLASYAKEKMADRIWVSRATPASAGRVLKGYLRRNGHDLHPKAEISVFGECLGECVDEAHQSLKDAGFRNAVIDRTKSI